MHTHILIIDADQAQANLLAFLLKTGGYDAVILRDPCRTSNILGERQIDLILLDARVPLVDGLLLCTHLKRQHEDVPLILLGTDATSAEIAVGLAHGADDYVRLPFDPAELLARIAALLRCYRGSIRVNGTTIVTVEHRHLDVARLTFTGTAGQVVDLTPTEMRLLRCLMEHTGTVIARAHLRKAAWRDNPGRICDPLDRYVMRLREKTGRHPADQDLIHNVPGVGYIYEERATALPVRPPID